MRLVLMFGVLCGVFAGIGLDRVALARGETQLERSQCIKFAREKDGLEKGGVREFLAMAPTDVRDKYGASAVERVRQYITLREKVLFQCPLNVLNATAAALDGRRTVLPPLPVAGPKRAKVTLPRGTLVPLPVKRLRR